MGSSPLSMSRVWEGEGRAEGKPDRLFMIVRHSFVASQPGKRRQQFSRRSPKARVSGRIEVGKGNYGHGKLFLCSVLLARDIYVEGRFKVKILYIIAAVLILFWFAGLIFKFIISPLIHLALVVGLGLIAWNFIQGSINRRAV
jgi:hypothetical protein